MSIGDIAGYVFVATLLGLLSWSLWRMRRRWLYLSLAGSFLGAELIIRLLSPLLFPRDRPYGLTYELNPARIAEEDLVWPNRILIFLLTSLTLWVVCRPQRRDVLVGAGAALVVGGGWPNLVEPWMRGYTTDYIALGSIVMNIADLCLVLGLPILLIGVIRAEVRGASRGPESDSGGAGS